MCRVSSFCFCASLEIGTVASAIGTTLLLAITSINGALFLSRAWNSYEKQQVDDLTLLLIQSSIYLTLSVIILISDGFLIMGLLQKRSTYLVPWLTLFIIAMILMVVYEGWYLNESGTALSLDSFILFLFKTLIFMFGNYLWIVCYSYYRELSYKGL